MALQISIFTSAREWWRSDLHPEREIRDTIEHDIDFRSGQATLLTADGALITGIARGGSRGPASSFERSVPFDRIAPIEPIPIESLTEAVRPAARSAAKERLQRGYGLLSETASDDVRRWIRRHHPHTAEVLDAVLDLPPGWLTERSDAAAIHTMEQDGVNSSLYLAGFNRTAALGDAVRPRQPEHLQFTQTSSNEDSIILDDLDVFPGWNRIKSLRPAGRVFEEPSTGRRLTVLHANKNNIELTTGVDIVYFVEDFSSFVLVQYKRVREEGGRRIVRVDEQFRKELNRMRQLEVSHRGHGGPGLIDHRLSDVTCFVKMCDTGQDIEVTGLAQGHYLDLGTWSALEHDKLLKGPKGGTRYPYDDVTRYLTNTEFAQLVGGGWIGSRASRFDALLDYILEQYQEGKSVIMSAIELGKTRRRSVRSGQYIRSRSVVTNDNTDGAEDRPR